MDDDVKKFAEALFGECSKCNAEPGRALHACPFKTEINDDYATLCDCGENCEHDCAMEV